MTLARRLFDILPTLFIIPIVNACTIQISKTVTYINSYKILKLEYFTALLYFVTVPIIIILPFEIEDFLSKIFNDSKYSNSDISLISNLLIIYCFSLTAYCSNSVITKALIVSHNVKTAYINLIFWLLPGILLPITTIFSCSLFGIYGIAIGNTIYMLFFHSLLGYYVQSKFFKIDILFEIKIILSILFITLITYISSRYILISVINDYSLRLMINLFIFLSLYIFIIYKLLPIFSHIFTILKAPTNDSNS